MKVLAVLPMLLRLNALGADELDRLAGVADLIRLGHEVRVLTPANRFRPEAESAAFYAERGINVRLVNNPYHGVSVARLEHLAYLDGAAWEYAQAPFLRALDAAINESRPDVLWCHGSYTWPAARHARRKYGIPSVIRSVNNEAAHLLDENGRNLAVRARTFGKLQSERAAVHESAAFAPITPVEQAFYRRFDAHKPMTVLPLRGLPDVLRPPRAAKQKSPLHVFSMGSTYNVRHNREALAFIVEQVLPAVRNAAPNEFIFHILGSKVPAPMLAYAAPDLIFDGYVPDLDAFLTDMDIALAPSLAGQGMQQKVFEPLCRGFATITSARALAGYRLRDGEHLLAAGDVRGVVNALLALRDPVWRASLAAAGNAQAHRLFDRPTLDAATQALLQQAT